VFERLPDQCRSNAESLCYERIERRLQCGQDIQLSRLNEHAKRASDSQSAPLRDGAASAFIDQDQVGVK
jgi:hypothetical protein